MIRWIRVDRAAKQAPSARSAEPARSRRSDRRRRPALEGMEGRQLLSAAVPATTAAVASPVPAVPTGGAPVAVRHTPMPPVRMWAGQPFDGVVASFVANTTLPADRLVAAIDWGDGTSSPATVEEDPWGGFNIRGAHTYPPGVSGMTWLRVDVADAATQQWIVGVEQRAFVSRTSPARASLFSAGFQPASSQTEAASRAQPVRLRFVERRQRYHEAADRYQQGTASADDIRYLRQILEFQRQQDKGFFEKLGDDFMNALPFG
ncbi:hypothetical protein [Tautonia sociabilis]|uniref:Uncharacterized protein n=1 Tax=Tautonia sociabilis TaxID=2080755 RepID=A0A432MJQ7_9BACT|nr:hypothetical protein [Tautonia sociabilis]RUL87644.1 hypothetical protein TsocGM_11590 [Tautonia sociabilis]